MPRAGSQTNPLTWSYPTGSVCIALAELSVDTPIGVTFYLKWSAGSCLEPCEGQRQLLRDEENNAEQITKINVSKGGVFLPNVIGRISLPQQHSKQVSVSRWKKPDSSGWKGCDHAATDLNVRLTLCYHLRRCRYISGNGVFISNDITSFFGQSEG